MLKVGTQDIAKIYCGGTAIQKAYVGGELVWPTAQPLPYDYEVEYIQRDTSIPWMEGGTRVIGGFDISQYIPSGQTMQNASPCSVTWSFDNNNAGVFYAFRYWANLFTSLTMWKGSATNVYSFATGSANQTTVTGDIDVFHEQSIVPLGNGAYQFLLDGLVFKEFTISNTAAITVANVLGAASSSSTATNIRFRVKHMRFADSVYLIPVVKGTQMGFYNTIDGQLFLAEQECLSAGPRVN